MDRILKELQLLRQQKEAVQVRAVTVVEGERVNRRRRWTPFDFEMRLTVKTVNVIHIVLN